LAPKSCFFDTPITAAILRKMRALVSWKKTSHLTPARTASVISPCPHPLPCRTPEGKGRRPAAAHVSTHPCWCSNVCTSPWPCGLVSIMPSLPVHAQAPTSKQRGAETWRYAETPTSKRLGQAPPHLPLLHSAAPCAHSAPAGLITLWVWVWSAGLLALPWSRCVGDALPSSLLLTPLDSCAPSPHATAPLLRCIQGATFAVVRGGGGGGQRRRRWWEHQALHLQNAPGHRPWRAPCFASSWLSVPLPCRNSAVFGSGSARSVARKDLRALRDTRRVLRCSACHARHVTGREKGLQVSS